MASQFAAGFFFGANFGGIDEEILFDCLWNEERAMVLFKNADELIR